MERRLALAFETLGIEPSASPDEIKQAHRDLVQVWHPDRYGNNERLRKKAEEKLKQINAAYDLICERISEGWTYQVEYARESTQQERTDYGQESDDQTERLEDAEPDFGDFSHLDSDHDVKHKGNKAMWLVALFIGVAICVVIAPRLSWVSTDAGSKALADKHLTVTGDEGNKPNDNSQASDSIKQPVDCGSYSQAIRETTIYDLPDPNSNVYYKVDKYSYLVTKKSEDQGWLQVLMENNTYGFVAAQDVAIFPIEITIMDGYYNMPPLPKEYEIVVSSPENQAEIRMKFGKDLPTKSELDKLLRAAKLTHEAKESTPKTLPPQRQREYWTIGSDKLEVKRIQGTPTAIIGDTWSYEYSSISFTNGRVSGYSDISKNLKVR